MNLFSKLFNQGESSALGIDIGSSAIKVVELTKKNGQAVLKTYGELALGPYANFSVGQAVSLSPDKVAEALSNLMKEKEVGVSSKRAGLAIPSSSSLMTLIEIPEVSAKQLSVIVPLEARKYVPVPISEVVLDWSIIPKTDVEVDKPVEEDDDEKDFNKQAPPPTKVDVLIVAIHKETIARYQEIVAKSGLESSFFEIEIFSTMRAVLDETLRPVMIMDIGSASTKLYIVERGIVRTSHSINRGSQDITSTISKSLGISSEKAEVLKRRAGLSGKNLGEEKDPSEIIILALDYIFTEANNTLLAFEKKYNKAVAKTILVGGGSALKELAELAKNNLKTEVVVSDPFSKVSAPAFLASILKSTGPEFAVAIGLALRQLAEGE